MTRLLGIDLGQRRIGLATADTSTGSVRPVATLHRSTGERDRGSLSRLIAEQRIDEIVCGLPLMLGGGEGPQALETRAWADDVIVPLGLPIAWRDERMTTERAIERIGHAGRGPAGGPPSATARRAYRARLDREAATLILQAELDERQKSGTGR